MNTDSMQKVVRLDENELQQLTQEVKETLASTPIYESENEKNLFTAIDMWNMQRQVRSASLMMRKWSN
ncbi:MAG: hypothetical protein JST09_16250 [Bacteroidetes bacterium]|nr:hypothetical protein [Bacteroidota bacterium]MBS1610480.1 hypothetical protein [Bacteroidota bacterium]